MYLVKGTTHNLLVGELCQKAQFVTDQSPQRDDRAKSDEYKGGHSQRKGTF